MPRAKNAITVEEVHDVRLNYLLYYAGYTEDLLIWEGKDVSMGKKVIIYWVEIASDISSMLLWNF